MSTAFSYGPQKTDRLASSAREWSVPYTLGSSSAMSWPDIFAAGKVLDEKPESADLTRRHVLEQMLEEVRGQWRTVVSNLPAPEVPEAFSLSPLSRRRIRIQVRKVEPAPFRFVLDDDAHVEIED